MNKQVDLSRTPRPHYLIEGEWAEREHGFVFKGVAAFPASGDATLEDRKRANVAHFLFAVWNTAHLAAKQGLLPPNIRVLSESGCYFEEVPLDTGVYIHGEAEVVRRSKAGIRGHVNIKFRSGNILVAAIQLTFLASD